MNCKKVNKMGFYSVFYHLIIHAVLIAFNGPRTKIDSCIFLPDISEAWLSYQSINHLYM